MEVAMTKISKNGQIVIPLEIRKEADIKPSTKFMVVSKGKNILLKRVTEDSFSEEMKLMKIIERAEKQIREGKVIEVNPDVSTEEFFAAISKKTPKKKK
jgi:AbrB family looped-hinge helix DNA binding protein